MPPSLRGYLVEADHERLGVRQLDEIAHLDVDEVFGSRALMVSVSPPGPLTVTACALVVIATIVTVGVISCRITAAGAERKRHKVDSTYPVDSASPGILWWP